MLLSSSDELLGLHHGEQFVFERHVGFGLETDTGAEDVGQGIALFGEGVDHRGAGRREWGLSLDISTYSLTIPQGVIHTLSI